MPASILHIQCLITFLSILLITWTDSTQNAKIPFLARRAKPCYCFANNSNKAGQKLSPGLHGILATLWGSSHKTCTPEQSIILSSVDSKKDSGFILFKVIYYHKACSLLNAELVQQCSSILVRTVRTQIILDQNDDDDNKTNLTVRSVTYSQTHQNAFRNTGFISWLECQSP